MFESKFERLYQSLGVSNDSELARALGITPPSVASARQKKQVPIGWIEKASALSNVTLDWLYYGRGPMRPGEEAKPPEKKTQITEEPRALASTKTTCERCVRLEKELEEERRERRELVAECRLAVVENRKLMKENGELKLEELKLSHRLDTAERMCRDYAAALKKTEATDPVFDEPQIIPSNSLLGR